MSHSLSFYLSLCPSFSLSLSTIIFKDNVIVFDYKGLMRHIPGIRMMMLRLAEECFPDMAVSEEHSFTINYINLIAMNNNYFVHINEENRFSLIYRLFHFILSLVCLYRNQYCQLSLELLSFIFHSCILQYSLLPILSLLSLLESFLSYPIIPAALLTFFSFLLFHFSY